MSAKAAAEKLSQLFLCFPLVSQSEIMKCNNVIILLEVFGGAVSIDDANSSLFVEYLENLETVCP